MSIFFIIIDRIQVNILQDIGFSHLDSNAKSYVSIPLKETLQG